MSSGAARGRPYWRVKIMGDLTVSRGRQHWNGAQVSFRRGRVLLALLAVESGRLVTVDRIVDTLWPTVRPQRPAANVATLVSRLRATFDPHFIHGGRNGYRLGDRVDSDMSAAFDLVTSAEAELSAQRFPAARSAAELALDLLREEALAELAGEPWILPTRRLRQRLLQRARHVTASAALSLGDPQAALTAAQKAIAAEPLDEEAHRQAMLASWAAGQPGRALRAYKKLRLALTRELGIDPAGSTQHLYLEILRATEPVGARRSSGLGSARRHAHRRTWRRYSSRLKGLWSVRGRTGAAPGPG